MWKTPAQFFFLFVQQTNNARLFLDHFYFWTSLIQMEAGQPGPEMNQYFGHTESHKYQFVLLIKIMQLLHYITQQTCKNTCVQQMAQRAWLLIELLVNPIAQIWRTNAQLHKHTYLSLLFVLCLLGHCIDLNCWHLNPVS